MKKKSPGKLLVFLLIASIVLILVCVSMLVSVHVLTLGLFGSSPFDIIGVMISLSLWGYAVYVMWREQPSEEQEVEVEERQDAA